jgi:hypothetical protein
MEWNSELGRVPPIPERRRDVFAYLRPPA